MNWYCEKCKKMHHDNEMCPRIQQQLKLHPELLSGAAKFTTIAGEYALITSNSLNTVAQGVNKIVGTNLSYEGTHQFARDIQVFKRLSEEPFKRAGTFATPENAKNYFETIQAASEQSPGALRSFESKLTGYAQEVDWLRYKQSQLSSVFEKSELLSNNAAGIDGVTINRFTGKTISRTTVKASQNVMTKNSTAINDVKEAITKGTATEQDIIFSTKGTEAAARKAGLKNPVIEKNTFEQVRASNQRLENKIVSGQATTSITLEQATQKMAQGAVIGAAVGMTVSSITNYIRYKNGELSREEAFSEISEDTLKSALVGSATAAVSLFIPGGAVGFIAGMAIGIYFNTACTNILDEIYGKGAYGAILNSSGFVYGMSTNLETQLERLSESAKRTSEHLRSAQRKYVEIEEGFSQFEQMKGE